MGRLRRGWYRADDDARGQLLLAGAFVLAVALIGLTLVFTSGGYTTTLASQDNGVQRGTDAVAVREAVASDLDRYLGRANAKYSGYADRQLAFRTFVPALSEGVRDQYGRHGRFVDLRQPAPTAVKTGYRVAQPTTDTFGDLDDDGDGVVTLASNRQARNVSFVFDTVPAAPSQFRIGFVTPSGSENWRVAVSQNGPGWDVTVQNSGGSYSQTCTRTGTSDDMAVNVSAATVDGRHCPALEAIRLESTTYDVVLSGDIGVAGRFWITVDDLSAGKASRYTTSSNTELSTVVYSARVPFRYHSSSVSYRTALRVAPGEIR